MGYTVYILQSKVDSSLYIGYTEDIEKRLTKHNKAKSGYTSRKTPWEVVYTEIFAEKREALKRERFLKKQRNKDFYNKLIASQRNIITL